MLSLFFIFNFIAKFGKFEFRPWFFLNFSISFICFIFFFWKFSHDLSFMQATDCVLFCRKVSVNLLSGALSGSYTSLSKIYDFTISFTKISGTLPTAFAGLGIFAVSVSLVSGSVPDKTLWRNVTVFSFSAAKLPSKTSFFNASSNWFSAPTLQLNAFPATISFVDLSQICSRDYCWKLTVQLSQSTSLVVNLKGNHIYCPLPEASL